MSNVLPPPPPPPPPGLAFPPHHGEPAPPAPQQPQSRPREDERPTRKRASLFDRTKVMLLLGGIWAFLVAATAGDNELLPLSEAMRRNLKGGPLLLVLAFAAELLRQVHYLIAESSPAYHQSWKRAFASNERMLEKLGDYNRFRISRALKFIFYLVVLAIVLGAITHTSPLTALIQVPARVISWLPVILQFGLAAFFIIFQFAALFWFLSKGGVDVYHPDEVRTRFSDVWGQDHVVDRVRENLVFLENPERIEEKGGYVPSGILLWGPPGTGKTLLAEAVAGETGKPFVFIDPGAFKAMFIGIDVLKVKSLFRRARRLAVRYGGVVLFFDEADTLGNRGQLAGGFGQATSLGEAWSHAPACNGFHYLSEPNRELLARHALGMAGGPPVEERKIIMGGGFGGGGGALQTLLAELSGLKKPRGFVNRHIRKALGMRPKPPPKYRILVMMASNMPEALDEALLRPGRIDRIYKVGYPALAGRVRTYEGYFAKIRHCLTTEEIERLATTTPYATGATIKDLVNESLIVAIGEGRDMVTWADVTKAKHIKALGPSENVDYIPRERHATSIHEACHAVAGYKTRYPMDIELATIEKGSNYLGMVRFVKPDDTHKMWRSDHEADVIVCLASLVGERMFFDGDSASGVSGDLQHATMVAALMESAWGMGETLAVNDVLSKMAIGKGGKAADRWGKFGSGDTGLDLGERIERKLAEMYQETERLLQENRAAILALAHALENNKTIPGADVEAIIDGREGALYDGRAYHLAGFQAQLEAYHAECVKAHRDQADVTAPMPALPPYHGPGSRGATWVLVPSD